MTQDGSVEDIARQRLRTLRTSKGWSLDDLAKRAHIGASTISRIETGHRRVALDQLVSLAAALDVGVDDLLSPADEDVVIRPNRDTTHGITYWPLTRPGDRSGRRVTKMRIPASRRKPDPQVHPGRDWFYVIEGTARLVLGDKEHLVEAGQAAEFDTMTPHWIVGYGGPVELLAIFDSDGQKAHLHH
jgi:transcriptional regulator with XRE-family HTH domain